MEQIYISSFNHKLQTFVIVHLDWILQLVMQLTHYQRNLLDAEPAAQPLFTLCTIKENKVPALFTQLQAYMDDEV